MLRGEWLGVVVIAVVALLVVTLLTDRSGFAWALGAAVVGGTIISSALMSRLRARSS